MRNYILSRPKGTFSEKVLQAFLKKEWITEDDYKQLSLVEQTNDSSNEPKSESSNEAPQSDNPQSNTSN